MGEHISDRRFKDTRIQAFIADDKHTKLTAHHITTPYLTEPTGGSLGAESP